MTLLHTPATLNVVRVSNFKLNVVRMSNFESKSLHSLGLSFTGDDGGGGGGGGGDGGDGGSGGCGSSSFCSIVFESSSFCSIVFELFGLLLSSENPTFRYSISSLPT